MNLFTFKGSRFYKEKTDVTTLTNCTKMISKRKKLIFKGVMGKHEYSVFNLSHFELWEIRF